MYSGDLLQDGEQHDHTEAAMYSATLSSKPYVFGENGSIVYGERGRRFKGLG